MRNGLQSGNLCRDKTMGAGMGQQQTGRGIDLYVGENTFSS